MKLSKAFTVELAISMVFAAAFVAEAGPFGPDFQNRGMEPEFAGLRTFLELKPSDSQQMEMMNIIMKYENESEGLRNSIIQVRKNLSTVLHTERFDEEAARKAFREASAIREELFVLRARMMAELRAVLTPEQQELLKDRGEQAIERMKQHFDVWLENPSE